jgi:hypothetical protein
VSITPVVANSQTETAKKDGGGGGAGAGGLGVILDGAVEIDTGMPLLFFATFLFIFNC